jgi:hypothetical protein
MVVMRADAADLKYRRRGVSASSPSASMSARRHFNRPLGILTGSGVFFA